MQVAAVKRWDAETDVLVVGYGYAGAAAAIAAADAGARVLLVEKMPHLGGLSITSGGGWAVADNAESAFRYMQTTCGGRTPDDVLRAFAEGLVSVSSWVSKLAEAVGTRVARDDERGGWSGATYPFPGNEAMSAMRIAPWSGFAGFPWVSGLRGGARLAYVLAENVRLRRVEAWFSAPACELVTRNGQELTGAVIRRNGREQLVRARRGVILACGGFEFADAMKKDFFQAMPVFGVTGLGNTGDGIAMAQSLGARLWHMWHFHGGYGFKYPDFKYAFRHTVSGPRSHDRLRKMPWIVVDKYGRRFFDEWHPAVQDTGARALDYYDPDHMEFPRIPCYLIFDNAGRQLGPIGFPIQVGDEHAYQWSEDNAKEVKAGWIWPAASLAELAEVINRRGHGKMQGSVLQATVERWNAVVHSEGPDEFDRLPVTRQSIAEAPYYAMEAWPIVSNTQGGPAHDAAQRVLRVDGNPIPRLYSAGELGSLFGHLYLEGGNIAECLISGRISGEHAASLRADT